MITHSKIYLYVAILYISFIIFSLFEITLYIRTLEIFMIMAGQNTMLFQML